MEKGNMILSPMIPSLKQFSNDSTQQTALLHRGTWRSGSVVKTMDINRKVIKQIMMTRRMPFWSWNQLSFFRNEWINKMTAALFVFYICNCRADRQKMLSAILTVT